MRNGSGKIKEFNDNGILIFEGEYQKGKRHRICKEYNDNGKLIFEGEYLKGKIKQCTEYYNNDNLVFHSQPPLIHQIPPTHSFNDPEDLSDPT